MYFRLFFIDKFSYNNCSSIYQVGQNMDISIMFILLVPKKFISYFVPGRIQTLQCYSHVAGFGKCAKPPKTRTPESCELQRNSHDCHSQQVRTTRKYICKSKMHKLLYQLSTILSLKLASKIYCEVNQSMCCTGWPNWLKSRIVTSPTRVFLY